MRRSLVKLRVDQTGSTLVEFAILAPVVIGMIFGVIQIGTSMQSYNAMRSITSDTARFATIEYMKKNEVTDAMLESFAENRSRQAPYLMRGTSFDATITDAVTPRVEGTFEKTITVTYTPPNFMPIFSYTMPQLSYSRPIFVIDE